MTRENIKLLSNTLSDLFDFTYKLTVALDKENAYTPEQAAKFSEIKQQLWLIQHKLEMPQDYS